MSNDERRAMLERVMAVKPLKDVIWLTQQAMLIFARGQSVANLSLERKIGQGTFAFYLTDMPAIYNEIERRVATIAEYSYQSILHEHTWTEWYRDVKECTKQAAENELQERKACYKVWCDTSEMLVNTIDENKRAKFLTLVSALTYPPIS